MELENLKSKVGKIPPPAALLINTLRSSQKTNLAVLCDFNQSAIVNIDVREEKEPEIHTAKVLDLPKGESLECISWSPDGRIFAAAGKKLHLYLVGQDFKEIAVVDLYYVAKDIDICCSHGNQENKYQIILAGPNGVEIHTYAVDGDDGRCNVLDVLSLHLELPIAHVRCSSDGRYLAVAAMDGHFGIWKIKEEMDEQKDFWFLHLRTLRITSVEFSEDSKKAAVSCWDGSFYVFHLHSEEDKFLWTQVEYNLNSPIEKVDGTLPGTLVAWSHHDKYFSLCNPTKTGSVIWVYCIETGTVKQCAVCSGGDYVKGLAVVKFNQEDCLAYFTRNKKFGFLRIRSEQGGELAKSAELQTEHWEKVLENEYGSVLFKHGISCPQLQIKACDAVVNCAKDFEAKCEMDNSERDADCAGGETEATHEGTGTDKKENDLRPTDTNTKETCIELGNKVACICQQISQSKKDGRNSDSALTYDVLLSHNVVGFISFLSARLYLLEQNVWKSVIFRSKVVKAFLCSGHWLVYLTSDNILCAFNLTNGDLRKSQSAIALDNSLDDITIVASSTQCYFVILDTNSTGNGHSLEVEFSERMQVKRQGLCLPFLSKSPDSKQPIIVLIGRLLIIQPKHHISETESYLFHVVIPGLGTYRSFPFDEKLTLREFYRRHLHDLLQLQRLARS